MQFDWSLQYLLNLVKNVIGFFLSAVFSKFFDMFVWTGGFQKSFAHTDFNMFVDEWTGANESPGKYHKLCIFIFNFRQLCHTETQTP